jgi:RNA polymerase sigma factor (TIGR02999 family)
MSAGDASVAPELMELIYGELHKLAEACMAREPENHTLQPTALLHEAYVHLFGKQEASWASRGHFYSMASKVMRSLLVDHARHKKREKRGGDWRRVTLAMETPSEDAVETEVDILDVHEALDRLALVDANLVEVVELRFFGGMSVKEISGAIELPVRSVERRLSIANTWLRARFHG